MKLSSVLGIFALITVLLIAFWLILFVIRLAILLLPLIIVIAIGYAIYRALRSKGVK